MTTANKITILRILLVPVFIVQVLYYVESGDEFNRLLAIVAFTVAAVCDGVDGYVARRFNQRSELGAVLDPLADKLLLVSGIVLLSLNNSPHLPRLPLWLTATVLSRDVVILLGLIVIQHTVGKVQVRARFIGKVATVLQMLTVLWLLLKWSPAWAQVWIIGAGILTGVSGLLYVGDGVRQLSASPASAPTAKQ